MVGFAQTSPKVAAKAIIRRTMCVGSTRRRLGGRNQLFELMESCSRPMKTRARATMPIHPHELWTLSPCPKSRASCRPSYFLESRSSVVTRDACSVRFSFGDGTV